MLSSLLRFIEFAKDTSNKAFDSCRKFASEVLL